MKKAGLTIFLAVLVLRLSAQDQYYVTIIKGAAYNTAHTQIRQGDKLSPDDKIMFDDMGGQMILLHPKKGRILITSAKKSPRENHAWISLKSYFNMNVQTTRLSTRALEPAPFLSGYFTISFPSVNSSLLIIDTLKIPLAENEFPDADNRDNFFFLQLRGPEKSTKKLLVKNRELLITRDDIVFNNELYSKEAGLLSLGYIQGFSSAMQTKLIASIEPVFLTKAQCLEIMRSVKSTLKNAPAAEILNEIYTQLYTLYGQPDMKLIQELYNSL